MESLFVDWFGLEHRIDEMNWIQRKIYMYNVTFGLYMLEWWERYLFSILLQTSYVMLILVDKL